MFNANSRQPATKDWKLFGVNPYQKNSLSCLKERKTYIMRALLFGDIEFGVKADPKTIKSRLLKEKKRVTFLEAVYITRMHRNDWEKFVEDPSSELPSMVLLRNNGDLALLIFLCYELEILNPSKECPAINLGLDLYAETIKKLANLEFKIPTKLSSSCTLFFMRLNESVGIPADLFPKRFLRLVGCELKRSEIVTKESPSFNSSTLKDEDFREFSALQFLKSLLNRFFINITLTSKSTRQSQIATSELVNLCAMHLATDDGTLAGWPVNFLTVLDTISPSFGAAVCKQYRFAVVYPPTRGVKIPLNVLEYFMLNLNEIGGYNANSKSTNPIISQYLIENQKSMSKLSTLFGKKMMQRLKDRGKSLEERRIHKPKHMHKHMHKHKHEHELDPNVLTQFPAGNGPRTAVKRPHSC